VASGPAASATPGASTTQTITGLSPATAYFAYCATATSQLVSNVVPFTTAGFTTQPSVSGSPTQTSVTLAFISGVTENVRCGVYPTASSPTAANVNAGTGAVVTPPPAASAIAGTSTTQTVTGLSAGTSYF